MKLLSPEKITDDKKKSEKDRTERVRSMNEEESRIVKKLNSARQSLSDEKIRIDKELQKLKENEREEIELLEKSISSRKQELGILMRPINEILNEAQRTLENAKQKENDIEKNRIALENDRALLSEKTNHLKKENRILSENTASLVLREEKLIQEQADHDRYSNARESRLRDEESRLNKWFEEEDAKLKKKELNIKHG